MNNSFRFSAPTLKSAITLSFLFLYLFSIAQDLKIVYNAENGSYRYFTGDKEISKPVVKKGGLILFKIENYNNYLYDVNFEESHESFKVAQGSGLLSGINNLSVDGLLGSMMDFQDSDADGVVDMMDFEPEVSEGFFIEDRELTAEEIRQARIAALETDAKERIYQISLITTDIEAESREVVKIEEQRILKTIAINEVQKIKYHPSIPPSKIKSYSKSYFEKVLDVSDISQVSLSYLLEKRSDKDKLRNILQRAEKSNKKYKREIKGLENISNELESLNARESSYYNIIEALDDKPNFEAIVGKLESSTQELLADAEEDKLQDLIGIWYEYEAISSNTFSKSFRAQGSGDMVNLDVSFMIKDSLRNVGAAPQINLARVKVPVYGGIKINASVGLNFGQFLKKPQEFFLRDTIIRSENGNQFIPYATSFLHFYKQGRRNVSLGGSLGLGMPLTDNTGFSSASFFVGPSLFFGNSERLVLNFGVMGGKVKRLAKGYEVGDVFYNDESFLPTTSFYEMGLYVGLSFNIAG